MYTATILLTYRSEGGNVWPLPKIAVDWEGVAMTHSRDVSARFALLVLVLIVFAATTSLAQYFPGRVTGRVQDAQGALIPGATEKLANPATGLERSATTDQNGEFNFPELALGTYDLTMSKPGFETTILKDIRTSEGQVNTLTPILKVGTVNTQVEVNSAP